MSDYVLYALIALGIVILAIGAYFVLEPFFQGLMDGLQGK